MGTGEILREDLYEADIYDILMSDNAAYIAGIFTRYVNGGQEVDLTASPGRLMIKLTDNGEGSNAAPDTYSLIAVAAEEWDNDPEDPFDFANEDLLGFLDLRAFNNTAGKMRSPTVPHAAASLAVPNSRALDRSEGRWNPKPRVAGGKGA